MTQLGPIPSDERIVDAMIQLACAAKSHRMIVAGSNSSEVLQELLRRGYSRIATQEHTALRAVKMTWLSSRGGSTR